MSGNMLSNVTFFIMKVIMNANGLSLDFEQQVPQTSIVLGIGLGLSLSELSVIQRNASGEIFQSWFSLIIVSISSRSWCCGVFTLPDAVSDAKTPKNGLWRIVWRCC